MSSRLSPGSLRTMDATAFSTAFFVNPSMTRAEHASSVSAPELPDERSRAGPLPRDILSFNSMITFWAVLSPMPFTAFMRLTSPVATAVDTSSGVRDDSIILAVLGPMPDTEIRRMNMRRSSLSKKP